MSIIGAALRELMTAGVTGDALVAAIERIEAEIPAPVSAGAMRQRRHIAKKNAALQASLVTDNDVGDANDAVSPPSSPSSSPLTLSLITTPSPTPSSSLRSESIESEIASDWPKDFREQFWNAYPRKVGKKAALRKVDAVRKSAEISWVALRAAIRRIERTDPQFIPHPLTWLTQGRYLDGAPVGTGPPGSGPQWKPPPGQESLEEIRAKYGAKPDAEASGTTVRSDAGVGQKGADLGSELRLPGGSALRPKVGGAQGDTPHDHPSKP